MITHSTDSLEFSKLIDIESIKKLLIHYYEITGFSSILIDNQNNIVTNAGWADICINFHRKNSDSLKNCHLQFSDFKDKLLNNDFIELKCSNGLFDIAFPIMLNQKLIAVLFAGQYLYDEEKENRDFFVKQAKKYNYDSLKYFKAVDNISFFSKKQVQQNIDYFLNLKDIITNQLTHSYQLITLSKETEESQEQLSAILNAIPSPVFVKDSRKVYIDCNSAFEDFINLKKSEIIGKSVYEIAPKENADLYEEADNRLLNGNENQQIYDSSVISSEGKQKEVTFYKSKFKNNGEIGIVGVILDITEKKKIERYIIESEEKYRSFIEQSNEGMILISNTGEIIEWNDAISKITGISKLESIGESIIEILHRILYDMPDDLFKIISEKLQDALSNRKSDIFNKIIDIQIKNKKNQIFDIQQILFPIEFSKKHFIGCIFLDITGVKRAEKKLSENEQFFKNITENMQDMLSVIDNNGILRYVSPAHKSFLGYDEILLMNKDYLDFIHDEDKEKVKKYFSTIIESKGSEKVEYRFRHIKGNYTWLESIGKILEDKQGKIKGIITNSRDISERKIAEAKERKYLRNNEFLTNTAMEFVDFTIGKDIFEYIAKSLKLLNNDIIISVNEIDYIKKKSTSRYLIGADKYLEKMVALLGTNPIGKKYDLNNSVDKLLSGNIEKVDNGFKDLFFDTISDDISKSLEYLLNVESIYAIGFTAEGMILGNAIFIIPKGTNLHNKRTIKTFSKQVSIALKKRYAEKEKEKAKESDRLKSAFLANMSHEIRTPMNGILGFCQLLKKGDIDQADREVILDEIDNSSKQLLNLINDIIDISKIEAGMIKVQETHTNLNALLKEMYFMFNNEIKRIGKDQIKLIVQSPLPDHLSNIWTDSFRLRQLFINLLNNASKFTTSGSIEYGYFIDDIEFIKFYVKDTGVGIPEDKIMMIFDRFKQVDEGFTRNYQGTGLGLAICKELVELMGGHIWIESKIGEGSTFFFTLPYITMEELSENITNHNTDIKYNWQNKKILIVEDNYKNYIYLKYALENTKAEIYRVEKGLDAIEVIKKDQEYNLILMDIRLPDMSGYDVTKEILKINERIPIIVQTAYAMEGDRELALQAGSCDYISKPFKPDDLKKIIQNFIL